MAPDLASAGCLGGRLFETGRKSWSGSTKERRLRAFKFPIDSPGCHYITPAHLHIHSLRGPPTAVANGSPLSRLATARLTRSLSLKAASEAHVVVVGVTTDLDPKVLPAGQPRGRVQIAGRRHARARVSGQVSPSRGGLCKCCGGP